MSNLPPALQLIITIIITTVTVPGAVVADGGMVGIVIVASGIVSTRVVDRDVVGGRTVGSSVAGITNIGHITYEIAVAVVVVIVEKCRREALLL